MEVPVFLPASQILARLLTVDSDASGLNANTLQGYAASAFALVGHTHNYQASNANLTALAGLTGAADKLNYFAGAGAMALADFTTFGRSLAAAADAAAGRTALALGTMATQAASGYLAASGATVGASASVQMLTLGAKLPSLQPLADGTTALRVFKADGSTAVANFDTTNSLLYVPSSVAATRTYIGPDGIYTTTNSGTSVNSMRMTSLEMRFDARATTRFFNNGTEWLAGGSNLINFIASQIAFSGGGGSINMFGGVLVGGNHLGLRALDNRFTVTVKQDVDGGGAADILRVQTQSAGAALYVDNTGRVAVGQTSANNKLDVAGTVQMDGLRIDTTPTAETPSMTHTITISANGTNYKIPCVAA